MRVTWGAMGLVLLFTGGGVVAQEAGTGSELQIERAAVALGVEEREPVGDDSTFPVDVGELACFTKVIGADEETFIYHVWRRGTKEMARVRLAVRGSSWRTWSTKRILPSWTGPWKVEIEDADGNILKTVSFVVGEDRPEAAS